MNAASPPKSGISAEEATIAIAVAAVVLVGWNLLNDASKNSQRQQRAAEAAAARQAAEEAESERQQEANMKREEELQGFVAGGEIGGAWFDEMEYGGGHLTLIRNVDGGLKMLLQVHDGSEAFTRDVTETESRTFRVVESTDFFVWAADGSLEIRDHEGLTRVARCLQAKIGVSVSEPTLR